MKLTDFLVIGALLLLHGGADTASSDGGAVPPLIETPSILNHHAFSCNCPRIYRPVCGTDGRTYSNDCVLRCVSDANVRNGRPHIYVNRQGECPHEACFCPAVVDPVCSTDSHTYSNECNLICESKRRQKLGLPAISVAYRGPCTSSACVCSVDVIPVCGTDGRTYRNICILQCASKVNQGQGMPPILYKHSGACAQESCICTLDLSPVCASDGKTYDNNCRLQCENRRRNALGLFPLVIRNRGPCNSCNCPDVSDPACASDDRTYRNPCLLDCENKSRETAGLPALKVLHKGACVCKCKKHFDPVCGSDERTYDNICVLQCESNRRLHQGLSPIFLEYGGACVCNCRNCDTEYQAVCGSDKRTYWNACWLKCHSDCDVRRGLPRIDQVKVGYC